ncbi:phage tail protein [Kitasatospora sp. NPDC091257]|uniref:phage tail protein n=1 Tax=Kitasatospora sp. NPDC091257 TaxID=3364084 RepID=UPI00380F07AF
MAESFATSWRFQVWIGMYDLGSFTTCDGLAANLEVEERWEGGLEAHRWVIPTRLSYSNIVLTRPLTSSTVAAWLWLRSQTMQSIPTIGTIAALAPNRSVIARWSMERVVPVRWEGPSFSAEDSRPGMETLEIAHHGFIVSPF